MKNSSPNQVLFCATPKTITAQQNAHQHSCNVRARGFQPAYKDNATGTVYLSVDNEGKPAPIHLLQSLPRELIIQSPDSDKVLAIKDSVIAGFVKDGKFYSRSQAASALKHER